MSKLRKQFQMRQVVPIPKDWNKLDLAKSALSRPYKVPVVVTEQASSRQTSQNQKSRPK